jgi:hypothetical protein
MRTLVYATLFAAAIVPPVQAQNVIETPKATIEIVGLKRWTIQMIDDSLAKYSPKDKLTAHACAAVLRDKLHFADASVGWYTNITQTQTKPYVAVTVVEPQDSALIHYRPAFSDSLPTRAEWAAAYAAFRAENQLAQTAIQTPSFYAREMSSQDSARFDKVRALHEVIVSHRASLDFETARRTLDSDGNAANRAMALLVLSNFAERDSAWWAVSDALRDPTSGMVNATASQVLRLMAARGARPVDWAPVAERLRFVIDGTNLFAFDELLRTLTATSVSPTLGPALLANGGAILRAKLHSGDVAAKDAARAFLVRLSGLLPTSETSVLDAWLDRTAGTR